MGRRSDGIILMVMVSLLALMAPMAASPAAEDAPAPAARGEALARSTQWIRQLADPDIDKRNEASANILDLAATDAGAVLSALEKAMGADGCDPETRARCEALCRRVPLEGLRRKVFADFPQDPALRKAAEDVLDDLCPQTLFLMTAVAGEANAAPVSRLLTALLELKEENPPPAAPFDSLGSSTDAKAGVRTALPHVPVRGTILNLLGPLLGKLGDRSQTGRIASCLTDGNEWTRAYAAHALAAVGDPSACGKLLQALEDPSLRVREAAIRALGKLSCREAVPRLGPFLSHENNSVQYAAVAALGEIGDRSISPEVMALLDSPRADLRRVAVALLGLLKEKTAAERITAFLSDRDSSMSCAAATALVQIGDPAVVPKAAGLLADGHPWVRWGACTVLVAFPNPELAGRLLPLLDDPVADLRRMAASGLFSSKAVADRKILAEAMALLDDEDVSVRCEVAILALRMAGQKQLTADAPVKVAREWWENQKAGEAGGSEVR